MPSNLIWIKNTLTTKIYKNFPDKYILIYSRNNDDFNDDDINIGDIILYRHTPKTYVRLGKVISIQNKKIAIEKLLDLGNHSKSKLMELL